MEEYWLKLEQEGVFESMNTLFLLDIPNEAMLKNIPVTCGEHELFVFARSYNDIKKGTKFSLIVPRKSINDMLETSVELRFVSVNPRYNTDYLPKGYSGICLLKFMHGIPNELLNKLALYDEKKDPHKHDVLILTQKELMTFLNSIT